MNTSFKVNDKVLDNGRYPASNKGKVGSITKIERGLIFVKFPGDNTNWTYFENELIKAKD